MLSFQANGTLKPNQISIQVKCLMTVQDVISNQVEMAHKYIHFAFDDTMTCKQFKAFSSIFPSYGCLYTTVKFVKYGRE